MFAAFSKAFRKRVVKDFEISYGRVQVCCHGNKLRIGELNACLDIFIHVADNNFQHVFVHCVEKNLYNELSTFKI